MLASAKQWLGESRLGRWWGEKRSTQAMIPAAVTAGVVTTVATLPLSTGMWWVAMGVLPHGLLQLWVTEETPSLRQKIELLITGLLASANVATLLLTDDVDAQEAGAGLALGLLGPQIIAGIYTTMLEGKLGWRDWKGGITSFGTRVDNYTGEGFSENNIRKESAYGSGDLSVFPIAVLPCLPSSGYYTAIHASAMLSFLIAGRQGYDARLAMVLGVAYALNLVTQRLQRTMSVNVIAHFLPLRDFAGMLTEYKLVPSMYHYIPHGLPLLLAEIGMLIINGLRLSGTAAAGHEASWMDAQVRTWLPDTGHEIVRWGAHGTVIAMNTWVLMRITLLALALEKNRQMKAARVTQSASGASGDTPRHKSKRPMGSGGAAAPTVQAWVPSKDPVSPHVLAMEAGYRDMEAQHQAAQAAARASAGQFTPTMVSIHEAEAKIRGMEVMLHAGDLAQAAVEDAPAKAARRAAKAEAAAIKKEEEAKTAARQALAAAEKHLGTLVEQARRLGFEASSKPQKTPDHQRVLREVAIAKSHIDYCQGSLFLLEGDSERGSRYHGKAINNNRLVSEAKAALAAQRRGTTEHTRAQLRLELLIAKITGESTDELQARLDRLPPEAVVTTSPLAGLPAGASRSQAMGSGAGAGAGAGAGSSSTDSTAAMQQRLRHGKGTGDSGRATATLPGVMAVTAPGTPYSSTTHYDALPGDERRAMRVRDILSAAPSTTTSPQEPSSSGSRKPRK